MMLKIKKIMKLSILTLCLVILGCGGEKVMKSKMEVHYKIFESFGELKQKETFANYKEFNKKGKVIKEKQYDTKNGKRKLIFTNKLEYDKDGNKVQWSRYLGKKLMYREKYEYSTNLVVKKGYNFLGELTEEYKKTYDKNGNIIGNYHYTYNKYGKTLEKDSYTVKYQYNSKNRMTRKEVFDLNRQRIEEDSYTIVSKYDDNNKIIAKNMYTFDRDLKRAEEYKYDDDQIMSKKRVWLSYGSTTPNIIYKYDDKGNVSKIVYYNESGVPTKKYEVTNEYY